MLCAVTFVMFAVVGGCKKSSDTLEPVGVLLQYDGCKQVAAAAGSRADGVKLAQMSDCFEFQYNANTLTLRHINAGFNCCPGEITADITLNGNVITITEKEQLQDCRCLCLFDLDFEIVNLAAGSYTIRVIEPYVDQNDQVLEFTVDLSPAASGNYCLERNYYPWIQ